MLYVAAIVAGLFALVLFCWSRLMLRVLEFPVLCLSLFSVIGLHFLWMHWDCVVLGAEPGALLWHWTTELCTLPAHGEHLPDLVHCQHPAQIAVSFPVRSVA